MRKNKLLLLLVLLLTAASGAWADTTVTWGATQLESIGNLAIGESKTVEGITITVLEGSNPTAPSNTNSTVYFSNMSVMMFRGNKGTNDFQFTSTIGNITKIEMASMNEPAAGDGWSNGVWTGNASTVYFGGSVVTQQVVFTIEEAAAPAGYTVSLKDGVKDADKWTVKVGEGQAQALPIGGLKGDGSETVTLQYNGRLKVKGVKATSDAAAPSVPDGAIGGKFSVSESKQVYFSKGNLRYASSKWSFFDKQYDYYTSYSADAWDHFGWSTAATDYGMNTSSTSSDYSGDFVDWGATMGTGWFTLTSDEWTYLLNTRSASTVGGTADGRYAKAKVNNVGGIILFPDTYTHPDGVTAPTGVNATDNTGWNGNSYTAADWTKMESAGCVFLPAAGLREETEVSSAGTSGYYWSATPKGTGWAYYVYFDSGFLNPASDDGGFNGCSVRLVREVTTTGAPAAKEPATVTTAPTGAAIVGVGKTTALVSGGVADGGTLMYAVTTTNTKPASTDGFSATVPTAQTVTASGKVYVWYYVKGDDTHSDSEIAATAIEVPVADIVWDATNVSGLYVGGTYMPYEKEDITLSGNAYQVNAMWAGYGNPETDGIAFDAYASGGFTFTAPAGKAFTKIEMNAQSPDGWFDANLGTGWAFNFDDITEICTVTWTGSAASTVGLLTGADEFIGAPVKSIAFYLSE